MKVLASVSSKMHGLAMRFLPMMITCRQLNDFLSDYVEGALPAAQVRKFELHLRLCEDCERYVEAYRKTIALSKAACQESDASAPAAVPDQLVNAVLAAMDGDQPDKS